MLTQKQLSAGENVVFVLIWDPGAEGGERGGGSWEKLGWDQRDGVTGYRSLAQQRGTGETPPHVLPSTVYYRLTVGNFQLHPQRWSNAPTLIVQQRYFTVVPSLVRCHDANIMFPSHLLESPGSHLSRQTWGLFILPPDNEEIGFGKIFYFMS